MYSDIKPCAVCGAEVRLESRSAPATRDGQLVGPADGVVGGADGPVDLRVCTNPECATHSSDDGGSPP